MYGGQVVVTGAPLALSLSAARRATLLSRDVQAAAARAVEMDAATQKELLAKADRLRPQVFELRKGQLAREPMAAKYILATLGILFLVAAATRTSRLGAWHPQVRTWWLIGAIFVVVSGWLFIRG